MIHTRRRRQRPPTQAQLEEICFEWNVCVAPGTPVHYWPNADRPESIETKTRSHAYVLSGHTAVVFIEGVAGCVSLEHVHPIDPSATLAPKFKPK